MTDILKELDEVIANGDPHTSDYFLRAHTPEIRAALELKARVDAGWVLVPREPTKPMVERGKNWDNLASRDNVVRVYRAMIAAAQRESAE